MQFLALGTATTAALAALKWVRAAEEAQFHSIVEALRPRPRAHPAFSHAMLQGLPSPAQAYFERHLQPLCPLYRSCDLELAGQVRLEPHPGWHPFIGQQTVTPGLGSAWQAKLNLGPLPLEGLEAFAPEMLVYSYRIFGRIPLPFGAKEADLRRSLAGRCLLESLFCPTALLPAAGATWHAVDQKRASVSLPFCGETLSMVLEVEDNGALRSAMTLRWGDPEEADRFAFYPFYFHVLQERDFGGCRVPVRLEVGYATPDGRQVPYYRPEVCGMRFV